MDIQNKYKIIVGMTTKDKKTHFTRCDIENIIIKCCNILKIEGLTLTYHRGLWRGEYENSVSLELIEVQDTQIINLITLLKEKLNQECVLLEHTHIKGGFL